MKKIAIIAAIILTTGLTALSINKKATAKIEKSSDVAAKDMTVVNTNLATAD